MGDSGICAVLLMDAQIDHVTGLLMLRERSTPLPLHATEQVFSDLSTGLPITHVLSHYRGDRHPVSRPKRNSACAESACVNTFRAN